MNVNKVGGTSVADTCQPERTTSLVAVKVYVNMVGGTSTMIADTCYTERITSLRVAKVYVCEQAKRLAELQLLWLILDTRNEEHLW